MKVTDRRFRVLFEVLATYWANCDPELAVAGLDEELPEIATVYILSNKEDEILYIGQTKHLNIRMAQHTSNAKILRAMGDWDRVYWMQPGVRHAGKRLQIEAALAIPCVPVANKAFMLRKNKQKTWSEIRWRRKRGR